CEPPGLAARRSVVARRPPRRAHPRHRAPRWGERRAGPRVRPPMKLTIAPEVAAALEANSPVVALESTVIAHGLPRPRNLTTAQALETEIRPFGVLPAM